MRHGRQDDRIAIIDVRFDFRTRYRDQLAGLTVYSPGTASNAGQHGSWPSTLRHPGRVPKWASSLPK